MANIVTTDDPRPSPTGRGDPRSRLDELRIAAIERAASLVNSFEGIVEATSDVATDDEHDPEGHTIAWERQQIAAVLEETRLTLTGIEAAERRLANGRYGTCTACGGEIAIERLDALPATPTCVRCASEAPGPDQAVEPSCREPDINGKLNRPSASVLAAKKVNRRPKEQP